MMAVDADETLKYLQIKAKSPGLGNKPKSRTGVSQELRLLLIT